jgi:hypothetical protein
MPHPSCGQRPIMAQTATTIAAELLHSPLLRPLVARPECACAIIPYTYQPEAFALVQTNWKRRQSWME